METSIDKIWEDFQKLSKVNQQETYKTIRELIGRRIEKRISEISSMNDDETLTDTICIELSQYQSFLFDAFMMIMNNHLICISDNFKFILDSMDRMEEFYQLHDQCRDDSYFVSFLKEENADIQIKIKELLSHDDSLKDTPFDILNLYPLLSSSIIHKVSI